jgi:outer membrane protein assembly factor BamB
MSRRFVLGLVWAVIFGGAVLPAGGTSARADETVTGIIPQTMAHRHGLTRDWFAQVDLNSAQARLQYVRLFPGLILAQSDRGTVQAIESETGRTLWAQQFGKRNWPTMPAGANEQFVAVVNGTTLYVVDRNDGDLKWSRSLDSSPSAGVALSAAASYVPMRRRTVESYTLDKPQRFPQLYTMRGSTDITPIVTHESVVWPTERGILYVVPLGGADPRFSIELRGSIVSAPSFNPPVLYVGTLAGFVYAICR